MLVANYSFNLDIIFLQHGRGQDLNSLKEHINHFRKGRKIDIC